jgi:starch synthase
MKVSVCLQQASRNHDSVDCYFVDYPDYFVRSGFYRDPGAVADYRDNDLRFALFARTVIEAVKRLNWTPDIIHVHDWQAALVPVYMKTAYLDDGFFAGAKTVLTIHNLGYQGLFEGDGFRQLGLPESLFYAATGALEYYGKVNFLKGGIVLADKITTVSEQYAREIVSSTELGCGLEGVLRDRSADLHGILNGVDYTVWSPSRDKLIPYRYRLSSLSGKRANRVELMKKAGLPLRDRVPLVAVISRLADQKGVDLITDSAAELFKLDLQMIVLGTGDEKYHLLLQKLQVRFPDQLKVYLEFDDALAHMIEAGADIFLMPSRYEPCGLNQLYSLKYGTVPVVRETGGLADTVTDFDPRTGEGTGFDFSDYTPQAMIEAVARAVELFPKRQAWKRLMKAGMKQDFSWRRSAAKYAELFESVIR